MDEHNTAGMNDYDEILVALRRITRAIDLHSKRLHKRTGLTTSQLLILQAVDRLGAPTSSAVAREILLSQPTVTNVLDRLEAHGLVTRERVEWDKRTRIVQMTDAGREALGEAPELLQEGFLREYRALPDWHRNLLVASLQHIAQLMDAEEIDASPILVTGDIGQHNAR